MKKIVLTTMLIGLVSLANISFAANPESANSSPDNSVKSMHFKDLKLTQDQAKALVNAKLIRHGKANAQIQKIEVANLINDKHFYLIYVSTTAGAQPNLLFIVDGQSGRTVLFPGKDHKRGMRHFSSMFKSHMFGSNQHDGLKPHTGPAA